MKKIFLLLLLSSSVVIALLYLAIRKPGLPEYRNDEFGFNFEYDPGDYGELFTGISPKRNINETGTGEFGLEIYLFDNYSKFNWFMNDGAFGEKVKYDKILNKWIVSLESTNATKEDVYCPFEVKTKNQNVPFYVVGDLRSGRANDYAFVVKKGILVIREPYPSEVRNNIIFDNHADVIKVRSDTCMND